MALFALLEVNIPLESTVRKKIEASKVGIITQINLAEIIPCWKEMNENDSSRM